MSNELSEIQQKYVKQIKELIKDVITNKMMKNEDKIIMINRCINHIVAYFTIKK